MIDKELIEIWRNMLKPAISLWMLNTNYEEMGEQDKEEFERDFDEILDLALIGLKYKTQLSQEDATKDATSDTISRRAAIDAVNNAFDRETLLTGFVRSIAVRAIRNMPSAQPEQNWIPCSKRLPKKDGRYQVTRYDYVTNTEFIDILWYEENLWWNRHSTGDYAVTAWMPLPKPYKEGGVDG